MHRLTAVEGVGAVTASLRWNCIIRHRVPSAWRSKGKAWYRPSPIVSQKMSTQRPPTHTVLRSAVRAVASCPAISRKTRASASAETSAPAGASPKPWNTIRSCFSSYGSSR